MIDPNMLPQVPPGVPSKVRPPRRKIGDDPRDALFDALEEAQDQLADDFSIIIAGRPRTPARRK